MRCLLTVVALLSFFSSEVACSELPPIVIERHSEPQLDATLSPGQTLIVYTAPRPVTAYHWEVDRLPKAIVRMSRDPTFENRGAAMPGSPQSTKFEFVALAKGTTKLRFIYLFGPTHPGGEISDRFEVKLTVR
jgi:predicted secreted protein